MLNLKLWHEGKVAHLCIFVDSSHFPTLTVLFRKQNINSKYYNSSFTSPRYFHPTEQEEWLPSMAASHSFSNWNCSPSPKSLVIGSLDTFPLPVICKWESANLLCNGQEAQEPSETSRVAREVPLFGDQTHSWLQLRRLGRLGWFDWLFGWY